MTRLQIMWMLPIVLGCLNSCSAKLDVIYEWKYIDYLWINDAQKQDAIACGEYEKTNIFPTDYQLLKDGRGMLITPRYNKNPATVSIISDKNGDGGPLLAPFPDWSWHKAGDCSGITSVNRVFLDDYDKLWLVDSGKIENEQVCPAKILKFDVETEELLLKVEIPNELIHSPSDESKGRVEIQAVEMVNDGVWVYISDIEGYGLIIWDGTHMWRLDGEPFYPTVEGEKFSINNENFTVRVGPQSFLLTPPGFLDQTYLMMKPLSSLKTYIAATEQLHASKSGSPVDYYISNFTPPSQEPGKAFTKKNGLLVASFTGETALACWNIQNPLTEEYVAVLETNSTTLQFVPTTKITAGDKEGDEILSVMSNRLQKQVLKTMDPNDVNFRVMTTEVNSFAAGTVCEPREHEVVNGIEAKNFAPFITL